MEFIRHLIAPLRKFQFSQERAVNSVKTAFACLIGLVIIRYTHFPMPSWLVISTFFVMATTIHVGGTLRRSYLRLLGTVLGACTSAAILLLVGQHLLLMDAFVLLLIVAFAYIASNPGDASYLGLLGGFTIIMILVNNQPTLQLVIERSAETFIGTLIGIAVARFVFPIRSKYFLQHLIAVTIQHLAALYRTIININLTDFTQQEAIEAELMRNFSRQTSLLQEAVAEHRKLKALLPIYQNILRCERGLFRSCYMLRQIFLSLGQPINMQQNPLLFKLTNLIQDIFDQMTKFSSPKNSENNELINQTIKQEIEDTVNAIANNNPFPSPIHLNTFVFCISHFVTVSLELASFLQQLTDSNTLK